MKALLKSVIVVALLSLCNFAYADDPLTPDPNGDFSKFTKEQLETIENNLLAGLESENSGIFQNSPKNSLKQLKTTCLQDWNLKIPA